MTSINKVEKLAFRKVKPTKRNIPYNAQSKYQDYREYLKEDFNGRCGYCDSYYGIVKKDYHIDHFVPKRVFEKFNTHKHLLNDYNNLIYTCPSCNRSKSGKWPSENPDVALTEKGGFINPCLDEYGEFFFRADNGGILVEEDNFVAVYIYKELSLFLNRHQITWKIEKLIELLNCQTFSEESSPKDLLIKELMHYLMKHFEIGNYKDAK